MGFSYVYISLLFLITIYVMVVAFKHSAATIRYLNFFILLGFTVEVLGLYNMNSEPEFKRIFNAYLYHTYGVLNLLYFWWFYAKSIVKYKHILRTLSIVAVISYFSIPEIFSTTFDGNSALIVILYTISLSIFWFVARIKNPVRMSIKDFPRFWISVALLFWGCFFLYRIIPNYFLYEQDPDLLAFMRNAFYVVLSIYYFLFCIAIQKFIPLKDNQKVTII